MTSKATPGSSLARPILAVGLILVGCSTSPPGADAAGGVGAGESGGMTTTAGAGQTAAGTGGTLGASGSRGDGGSAVGPAGASGMGAGGGAGPSPVGIGDQPWPEPLA